MILISCSEDGDHSFGIITKEAFLRHMNEGYYGDNPVFAEPGKAVDLERFSGYILIDGDIVQPKPVQHVTKYTI